jgi:hypothetical protein
VFSFISYSSKITKTTTYVQKCIKYRIKPEAVCFTRIPVASAAGNLVENNEEIYAIIGRLRAW